LRAGPDGPSTCCPNCCAGPRPTSRGRRRTGALAPLDALAPRQQRRLAATLASWVRHWGQRSPIAAEPGVHPQTVAYRVNRLRAVFGQDLDDPAWRLDAQLALIGRAAEGA
jgi:DNA-binding PucR family transcriptional regulator